MNNKAWLIPTDGRKSFHEKAWVIMDAENGVIACYSYGTLVASYAVGEESGGELRRHWGGWSATTGRHIVAFCDFCCIPSVNKAGWDKMKVVKFVK